MTGKAHDDITDSGGLIAIVDDEPMVRSATSTLLRSLGFECRIFSCAEELLNDGIGALGCVLSDIQMPGMSGVVLAQRLREQAPGVPVILMSAYPNEMAITMRADGRIAALLDKPLDGDVLQAAVRTAVAGR
jgi:FixJ family two-component response regulator